MPKNGGRMARTIKLNWGFHCRAKEIGGDKDNFIGKNKGVYLWIYRNSAGCRVAYVGKCVSSPFKKRFAEHFRMFFGAGYTVFKVDSETDYLHFYAENIAQKKIGDKELLAHEGICWYQNLNHENYFRDMFFVGSKKRPEILDHHLDHLEFAFATFPEQESLVDDARRVEAALGKGLHEYYLKVLPDHLKSQRFFPSGNSMDTFVGRHSHSKKDSPVQIEHIVSPSLREMIPAEVFKVTRYPNP